LEVFHVEFDGTSFSGKEFEEVGIETDPAGQNKCDSKNDEESKEDLPIIMETEIGDPFKQSLYHTVRDYNRFIRDM
jgi:hypothetical protein